MENHQEFTDTALRHITHLSQSIGGRGSCQAEERSAADYLAGVLTSLGVSGVELQPFKAIPSTYWPFALGFGLALLGSLVGLTAATRATLALAAAANLAGAWAMLSESEFASHWGRWLLPKKSSQNVLGQIPPQGEIRQRLILCAHLDTHRTPVFYSSAAWHKIFSALLGLTLFSMAAGSLVFVLGAVGGWLGMRWFGLLSAPVQAFALAMCLHADRTPFSPGANDNASGVGVALGLVQRLGLEPLAHTQVHLAFTGCEEVGSYGIQAYLDQHSHELEEGAVYVILDEVGLGEIKYLRNDGLLIKHPTHPSAMALARTVASSYPEMKVVERDGLAYTDALSATRRGLIALTVSCDASPESGSLSHWHQMSDTVETLQPETLQRAHEFTWQVMQTVDGAASAPR